MKTWLSWSELAGTPRLTSAEFRGFLRQYPRSALLFACSRLSIIFNFGPDADTAATEKLTTEWIPKLFHPSLAPRVGAFAERGRVIFFQGQLRYLAAEVMRLEPPYADESLVFADTALGGLLLAAGELLYRPHVKPTDDLDVMANLVAEFLPIYEITSITVPPMLFLRFHIFLTVIIPQLPDDLRTFDVDARFGQHIGFPLKRYSQFIFAFIMHARLERNQPACAPIDGALRMLWFKNSTVPIEQISQMFDTVSFSLKRPPG